MRGELDPSATRAQSEGPHLVSYRPFEGRICRLIAWRSTVGFGGKSGLFVERRVLLQPGWAAARLVLRLPHNARSIYHSSTPQA